MGPARMIVECLTPRPGTREQNGQKHVRQPRRDQTLRGDLVPGVEASIIGCEECGARRTRAPFFSLSHRTKRFEGCAHIGHEERRLFPGREVCAFGMVAVVDELHIRLLCPALRRLIDFSKRKVLI